MQEVVYVLFPEPVGRYGGKVVPDFPQSDNDISLLHVVFEGWSGDHLVKAGKSYLVSEEVAEAITQHGVTGFGLGEVVVSRQAGSRIAEGFPRWLWLRVIGEANKDHIALLNGRLTVSASVLEILRQFRLNSCEIYQADKAPSPEARIKKIMSQLKGVAEGGP